MIGIIGGSGLYKLEGFEVIDNMGFSRVMVDGEYMRILEVPPLDKNKKHNIDLVVDRLTLEEEERARTRA